MSMLPLDLGGVLDAFTHPTPIRVTEVEGHNDGGRWKTTDLPERSIQAVVLVPDIEEIEFLTAGDASRGVINVMTCSELFFTDIKNDNDGEYIEGRQSFIHFKGYVYRVARDGLTMGNTIFNSYDCIRYLKQVQ